MNTSQQLSDSEKDLKKIIKEAIQEEMMKFRSELIEYISDKEQKEIDELYGNPESQEIGASFQINL